MVKLIPEFHEKYLEMLLEEIVGQKADARL